MTNLEEIKKWIENPKLYKLLDTLGKKWTLLILVCIYTGIHTFSDIMKALPEINTSILTKRLQELTKEGFIIKSSKSQKASKPEYYLSKKGEEVVKGLEARKEWLTDYYLSNINHKHIK